MIVFTLLVCRIALYTVVQPVDSKQWPQQLVHTAHFRCFYFLMHLIVCFFHDCLDILSQDSRPVRKSARWTPHFFFNSAPPIRATRNGHMGCWKSKTWKGLWKACRSFDFIQDKQPFMNTSSLSEKRRASGDIAPVSSLTRTAMCIFFQNNCSILQKHSS